MDTKPSEQTDVTPTQPDDQQGAQQQQQQSQQPATVCTHLYMIHPRQNVAKNIPFGLTPDMNSSVMLHLISGSGYRFVDVMEIVTVKNP